MKDDSRRAQILLLWQQRPTEKRTGNDLLVFHGELLEHHPELLNRRQGDSYQQLKVDLSGHIQGE